MSVQAERNTGLEIGHVLFIDIVGYSKRLVNEQTALIERLNHLVRSTGEFRKAETEGKLIKIPTGDGMALVFFTAPDAPVRCAIEISKADQQDPKIELRMGIHSGPVDRVADVNARANVAGTGINTAQRVMDCGDSGHILLSQRVAEDLAQYATWQPHLHPLGEVEVKHGFRLNVFNFYSGNRQSGRRLAAESPDFGNPAVPVKLKQIADVRRSAELAERKRGAKKKLIVAGIAALLLLGALAASYRFLVQRAERVVRERGLEIPAKSIAVLPFENLIPDQANSFLAGGIQDEIITHLSKIADLKVISRTSTMQYGSKPANLKQIAKELGVAAILEGSVQKVADQVHVNVQLIKAATDMHLWSQTYDSALIDLLKAQSEIAQKVAVELNTTLTTDEKARIEQKVTTHPEAYAFFLKGTEVLRRPAVSADRMEEGQHYFEQAIDLDPDFALAHARLGLLHSRIATFFDPSPLHVEKGRTEAEQALRLQPSLSEAHIALGFYNGRVARDYDAALKHYELAKNAAPNDVEINYGIAHVQMKRGQFRAAIANWERATSLDPMNWKIFDNYSNCLAAVGMFSAAEKAKRRAMELASGSPIDKLAEQMGWAWAYYILTGTTEKVNEIIAQNQGLDDSTGFLALSIYGVAMIDRDFDRAEQAIEKSKVAIFETFAGPRATKKFLLGTVALARGQTSKSQPLFEAELPFAQSEIADAPDAAARHAQLGLICAYLGRKDEAIAEGKRAVELLPTSKDAVDGPNYEGALAEIYGRVGEPEKAVDLLEKLMTTPGGPPQLVLKECPWDPIRDNPRFQKLLNGPPPKIVYQ